MRSKLMLNGLALLSGAWRRRYMIAIPVVLMPFVGLAGGLLSPKTYETFTTILIQEPAKQNPFLEDLTVATNLESRMEALNALLHSRHILAEVAFSLEMISDETPEAEAQRVIGELSRSLSARLVGEELVEIRYRARKPDGMDEVLKRVSVRFVERIIAPQRSSIASSERFLGSELEARRKDLETAETTLARYKNENAEALPELHAGNVARLAQLRQRLSDRRSELEGARAEQDALKARLSQTNPVVGRIEEAIVDVMSELAVLRSRYTDRHSSVQAALRKLRSLEEERGRLMTAAEDLDKADLERLWNMATTARLSVDETTQPLLVSQLQSLQDAENRVLALAEETAQLTREVAELDQQVAAFGNHERRLNELTREIQVKRKIYEDLAERHQLARVTGSLGRAEEQERVKLIDPPFKPLAPSNLPLPIFIIAGLVGGLAFGCGLGLAAELLDTRIRRRDKLTELLGIPVIARIPVLADEAFLPDGTGLDPEALAWPDTEEEEEEEDDRKAA
ncbi:MAG: GumC family protein [Magnetovibrionaceae bacterium]